MKTTTLKKSEIQKAWHLLDATDISVGRLASRVSLILKGKNKPQYSPNLPVGDGVIIINTDKVKFSGNKNTEKKYYKHTGYPGGIKETTPDKLKQNNKSNDIIKKAYQDLNNRENKNFDFYGYVEGNHIMDGKVNVIVTDGFTGNIALKTAEGTANFIVKEFKDSMTSNLMGKISSLINLKNLNKVKKKLDPRLYNGAILIGLDSPVVKSHGSTDEIGFANSLKVCEKIIKGNLIDKIKKNII